MPRVHVQIDWPPGLDPLPATAQARVTVEDAGRADADSVVLAQTVLTKLSADHPALAEIEVPDVDPRGYYIVRVHVDRAGRESRDVEIGDLVSTQAYPVLTRGYSDQVAVAPQVVG